MDITSFIASRYVPEKRRMLVGICGRAGAGKTVLAEKLSKELHDAGILNLVYSGDWRFSMSSTERKLWLEEKQKEGLTEYLYAANQFNWWDFGLIERDLAELAKGNTVQIHKAYNRSTGKRELEMSINGLEKGIIIFENAILGGVEILQELDLIVLLNTSGAVCFERILKKDSARRTVPEIASRYLITTHSENIFFKVLEKFSGKVVACSDEGRLDGISSELPRPARSAADSLRIFPR